MCCDSMYTSKYRNKNTPSDYIQGECECICDCKLVRSLKDIENKTSSPANLVPINKNSQD